MSQIASEIDSPAGTYYHLLSKNHSDPSLFAINNLQDCYIGRSLVSMAIAVRNKGELDYAFRLCLEAIELAQRWNDPIAMYQAQQQIAIIQSEKGNHPEALQCLENAFPLVRFIAKTRPAWYYDYLNSRAFELTELGRLVEARYNIEIALASPFCSAYHGWLETSRGIAEKQEQRPSHSIISGINFNYDNVREFDDARPVRHSQPQVSKGIATVSSLTEHKEMAKKSNPKEPATEPKQEPTEDYVHLEKRAELHRIIADPDTTGEQLEELLRHYEQMKSKQTEQK